MNLLRATILRFDDWLSRTDGVIHFEDEPRIILRIQRAAASREIPLPDHGVPRGSPVLLVHLWNERMPAIASQGADLGWALGFKRRLLYSFGALALHMQRTVSMNDIHGVGGVIAHIHADIPDGGRLLLERLGFTILPYHRPAGAFGEFWENFYTWVLIWAYNPGSLRSHALPGLQRNEFWTTRERFLERFGQA